MIRKPDLSNLQRSIACTDGSLQLRLVPILFVSHAIRKRSSAVGLLPICRLSAQKAPPSFSGKDLAISSMAW